MSDHRRCTSSRPASPHRPVLAAAALLAALLAVVLPTVAVPTASGAATPFEDYSADPSLSGDHADVLRLYWAFFDREPDVDGARYWVTQSNQCASLRVIAASFAASTEFANTYGALDDAGMVDLVYANVLDRAPDDAGRAYWLGELGSRRLDHTGLVLYFSLSAEFRNRHPLPSDGRPSSPCVPPKPVTLTPPSPGPTTPPSNVVYANCTEAWNAGVAPIFRGQPGYRPALDSDNDGEACEKDPR